MRVYARKRSVLFQSIFVNLINFVYRACAFCIHIHIYPSIHSVHKYHDLNVRKTSFGDYWSGGKEFQLSLIIISWLIDIIHSFTPKNRSIYISCSFFNFFGEKCQNARKPKWMIAKVMRVRNVPIFFLFISVFLKWCTMHSNAVSVFPLPETKLSNSLPFLRKLVREKNTSSCN